MGGATYRAASHPYCAQRGPAVQLHVYRGVLGWPCAGLTLDFSQLAYSCPEKSLPGPNGFSLRPAVLSPHRQQPREIATSTQAQQPQYPHPCAEAIQRRA